MKRYASVDGRPFRGGAGSGVFLSRAGRYGGQRGLSGAWFRSGRGSSSGFVVGLSDHADLPDERIRPLLGAMQPYPVILPELIELADWLHGRYLCNLVDALRTDDSRRSCAAAACASSSAAMRAADAFRRAGRGVYLRAWRAPNGRSRYVRALQRCGEMPSAQLDAAALRALVRKTGAVELREVGLRRTPSALSRRRPRAAILS